MTMHYPIAPEAATKFLHFVNASPTPYHAVDNASTRLEKAGFEKVCTIVIIAIEVENNAVAYGR